MYLGRSFFVQCVIWNDSAACFDNSHICFVFQVFFPWIIPVVKLFGFGLFDADNRAFFTQLVGQITAGRNESDKVGRAYQMLRQWMDH